MNENINSNGEINNSENNKINPNKSGKSINIVLVLCGLIAVCIIGFITYKEFILDKVNTTKLINQKNINDEKTKQNNDNKQKDNTINNNKVENEDSSNNQTNNNNIVKKDDDKSNNDIEENESNNENKTDNSIVNDTSNNIDGLSTELYNEIKKSIDEVPYTSIITSNISYKELYELYILTKLYDFPKDEIEFNYNYENIVVDKNGVKYADNNSSQYLTAKALGFTVDEIKKLHLDKWEHYINVDSGGSNYGIIDGKIMRDRAKKLNYDLILNETKLFKLDLIINYPHEYVIYEKDLDLYIIHFGDGIVPGVSDKKIILNGKLNDEILKINYVETSVIYDEECSIRNKDNKYEKVDAKCKVISEYDKDDFRKLDKYFEQYVKSHKENFSQYEISFKISNDNYEFVDIKKIN